MRFFGVVMTATLPWFRIYDEALDDPKVQRLSDALFRHWFNLLCLANRGNPRGRLPDNLDDVAYSLRLTPRKTRQVLDELISRGLLVLEENTSRVMPNNWDERQKVSDASNERVQAYRKRLAEVGGSTYTKHRDVVLARDGNACVYCGSEEKLVIDHLIPVQRGGDSEISNLVTACKSCNAGKAGRLLEETRMAFVNPAYNAVYDREKARLVTTRHSDSNALDIEVEIDTEKRREEDTPSSPPRLNGADAPETERIDPLFLQFWQLYPTGRGKRIPSMREWNRLKAAEKHAALERLPLFVASHDWQKEGGRFVRHAERWLKEKGWRDDIPPDPIRAPQHTTPKNTVAYEFFAMAQGDDL